MSVTIYMGTSYKIWYWSLHVTLRGVHLHLVSICALVSIYFYKFTVSNGGGGSFGFGIYMVSIYSYKLTVLNGGGGSSGFDIYMVSIYSYKLTILNGGGGSFGFGFYMCIGLYIFL